MKTFRCHYCEFAGPDPEDVFQHMLTVHRRDSQGRQLHGIATDPSLRWRGGSRKAAVPV